jgi:hypothetical protein
MPAVLTSARGPLSRVCMRAFLSSLVVSAVLGSAGTVVAVPSAAAQSQAPSVWVNTRSGVYHCPGTRYYGATKSGQMMSEGAAIAQGHRPAYGRACGGGTAAAVSGPDESPTSESPPAPAREKEDVAGGSKVWVNTRSGVYHCPGTRYYGATAQGRYMTQAEARAAGHRAAYGRSCS